MASKPIFVFDNPRTRSHLFWRWIGTHPDLRTEYHPYLLAAHLGPENFYRDIRCSPQRREVIEKYGVTDVPDTFNSATQDLQKAVNRASNQRLFVSDHCHRLVKRDLLFSVIRSERQPQDAPSNPTLIPDSLLLKFDPIILIRHPIFTIPSFYKQMTRFNLCFESDGEDMRLQTTLQYAWLIFEYLREATGRPPIVVDGDDIVWRAGEVKEGVCAALGLDAAGVQDSWGPTPVEERPTNQYVWEFTKVAHESTGIERVPSKPAVPSIDEAFEGWRKEYGGEVAGHLRSLVEAEMAHYDYLKQFKI
ncbi:uncharacterized protein LTR77_002143 [Saxophila tyrrhenica]|uniref:Uncharacterized protein n=1 Tax=Saxophila tyrrhenica TaxID=1690608 RepID=A0AAV9PI43_9PEZI|nr:hypothetical protein LTR77_002143 [Saxophila tyrrhenica]